VVHKIERYAGLMVTCFLRTSNSDANNCVPRDFLAVASYRLMCPDEPCLRR
jgi:hypothetical protein